MRPMPRFCFALVLGLAACGLGAGALADVTLAPPKGYRLWFHVNTAIIDKPSPLFDRLGGLHNVYLSPGGLGAFKNGKPFPNGTIFADDIHEFTVAEGVYSQGPRKALAVMVRDSKKYAATGGWGFQLWAGGDPKRPVVTDPAAQCFACHTQRKEQQYVFSTYIP